MILQLNILGFSHHHRHRHRHHHHCHRHRVMSEVQLASLQAFRSLVSEHLNRALESLKLEPEFLSLAWIHQCFHILPMINNAFAKLMVEIDYPVGSWDGGSIDEYLDYTINMLHLLNSISSSISHVNQARVSLTHALTLMESSPSLAVERMKEIKKQDSIMEFKSNGGDHVDRNRNEKEWIFHEAVKVLRSSGYWVCGVVLSGFNNEVDPLIMEMKGNMVSIDTSLMASNCMFKKKLMEKGGILKEVEEVNESVRSIVTSGVDNCDGGMELKRRLEVVGNGLKGLREEEECVFGTLMTARNEVLEILRTNNK